MAFIPLSADKLPLPCLQSQLTLWHGYQKYVTEDGSWLLSAMSSCKGCVFDVLKMFLKACLSLSLSTGWISSWAWMNPASCDRAEAFQKLRLIAWKRCHNCRSKHGGAGHRWFHWGDCVVDGWIHVYRLERRFKARKWQQVAHISGSLESNGIPL